ncbi:MAG: T9SS type A sorting domain-containing protein [Cytophagaceae bacterium]|nr:T9SS type A sorting domain-containing protein [Cytophagaceae bacterium]
MLAQLKITFPVDRIVFQRENTNQATIRIIGTYGEPIDLVEVRFLPFRSNQGKATNWLTLQKNPQNGRFSGSISVPGGWYRLEVRGQLQKAVVGSPVVVEHVGIGEVFLIVGHSLAGGTNDSPSRGASDDRVNSANFSTSVPGFRNYQASANPIFLPMTFSHLDQGNGMAPFNIIPWFWSQLGDLLAQRLNVPILFYGASFGGTSLEQTYKAAAGIPFSHGFINYNVGMPYVNIRNALQTYAPLTGLRAVLAMHGENDRIDDQGALKTSEAIAYYYQYIIRKSRQDANFPNLTWIVANCSWSNGPAEHIIKAQNLVITNANYQAPIGEELLTSTPTPGVVRGPNLDVMRNDYRVDGLHYNAAGQATAARLWADVLTPATLAAIEPKLSPASARDFTNLFTNLTAVLFPNPSIGGVTIKTSGGSVKQVSLYDLQGRLLHQQSAPELQVADLAAGMYLVEIETTDGRTVRKRLLKHQ